MDYVSPKLQYEHALIKTYFTLTKPGIIMGNAITAAAGFALASKGSMDLRLLMLLVGLSLIIGSACVFNNYIDRKADEKMARTKNRALVKGLIPLHHAIIFATFLGFLGFLILSLSTNFLTVLVAAIGFFVYVILYSFLKYRTTSATLIGSISGAAAPVIGYCAVSNRFDMGAFLLFMIVVLWQMPHFFAIALYRLDDYAGASIPVLPVKKGAAVTKVHILLYIIAFILATFALTIMGYTGYPYLVVMAVVGFAWLGLCLKGFKSVNVQLWARKMFQFSLVVIMILSTMILMDVVKK